MAAVFAGYAGVVIVFLLNDGRTIVTELEEPEDVEMEQYLAETGAPFGARRVNLSVRLGVMRSVTMTQHRADCPWPDDCSCAG